MRKLIFFAALLIATVTLYPVPSAASIASVASKKEKQALEMELRYWAFNAVTTLLTYNHNNFTENIEQNKALLTERGCKTFLWTLDKYGLSDGIIERKESLITNELWRIRSVTKEILLIRVNDLHDKEPRWHVWVPLILKRQKGLLNTRYRYQAHIEIKMEGTPHKFIITRWLPSSDALGIPIKHKNKKFKEKNYPECDSILYKDIDNYKRP